MFEILRLFFLIVFLMKFVILYIYAVGSQRDGIELLLAILAIIGLIF